MKLSLSTNGLCAAALALSALALAPSVHAAETPSTDKPFTAASLFNPAAPINVSSDDFRYQPSGISSSTDDANAAADPTASLSADTGTQPPPGRRSYGRSRYQDRMHNADGSTKIAFMAGGGATVPTGNTAKYYTPSWTVAAGAGINFNRMFGILGEFHYDHMGVTGGAINYEYNNVLAVIQQQGYSADDLDGFDANAHVLSLTVNPIINFSDPRSKVGAYVTGGGGWYRKSTNFTLPTAQTGCNYYYCQTFYTTYDLDSYSANTFGWNIGFGLTYKLSEFSSERLFVDARYHWAPIKDNKGADFFPFNARHTGYIPVTVGIRF
ncbi:MAG: hypothetical protein V4734_05565 [Terriglobus sp.]